MFQQVFKLLPNWTKSFCDLWNMLVPTTTALKQSRIFREPYVKTGYRQCNQPWIYYFLSIFQVNNECLNVWTHLIGLLAIVFKSWIISYSLDLFNDPYIWPLSAEIIAMLCLYCFSITAHCLCSKSEVAHQIFFMLDYAGIGLYGLGSCLAHYWYCVHEDIVGSFLHRFAALGGIAFSTLVCLCCSVSKIACFQHQFNRRPWQICSVSAMYLHLIFPILYKLYLYLFYNHWEPSLPDHARHIFWFLCSGFFFSFRFPECLFSGYFDFVGRSHQLFHVCITMTSLAQLDAIYKDISTSKDHYDSEPPTIMGTYGAVFCGLLINLCIVFSLIPAAKRKVAKD